MHEHSYCGADTSMSAALRSVGLLDVLFEYAYVALPSRALHPRPSPPLATELHA